MTKKTFDITYSDLPNLNFYAIVFSAKDLSKAWNPSTLSFETYSLSNQTAFVLPLVEDLNRIGWYKYSIINVTNIPDVVGDEFYFIEVWQKKTESFNRSLDLNTGYLQVFWNKEQNDWFEISKKVWEYEARELTDFSGITPQQIWEYSTRTLTAGGLVDCDYSKLEAHILAAITLSTGKTLEELSKVNSELGNSIQKTFDLLKTCCGDNNKGDPNVQIPRLGSKGSKGRASDMRIK